MMGNYMPEPEDDYDVFIEGDLNNDEVARCHQYDSSILSARLVPQLYSTVFVTGLLGNTWLVFVLVRYKGLRHMENIYFLNLAISNLCFLFTLPFWALAAAHRGILVDRLCKVLTGLYSAGLYGEALWNVLLTVQRYRELFNMRRISSVAITACRGLIRSVLAWGAVALVTLPEFMFYKPQKHQCSFNRTSFLPADEPFWKYFLTLKMNILGLLFPLFVCMFCYLQMIKTRRFWERRNDIFKLVYTIMVVFLLMWGPYNIMLFLNTFKEHFSLNDCKSTYHLDRGVQISKLLAAFHCCVNPLLFVFFDPVYRCGICHPCQLCNHTPLEGTEAPEQAPSQEEHNCSSEV